MKNLTLTLTLNLLLFFLSWFLWLYNFYGLFTAYFLCGGNVSWRRYVNKDINIEHQSNHINNSNVNISIVNCVKTNIKDSTDLNSGNSTKDFTITSSSSHKNYKNSNTDNSLNVKSYNSRHVQENRKIIENRNSDNGTIDFTLTSSSYNVYKVTILMAILQT